MHGRHAAKHRTGQVQRLLGPWVELWVQRNRSVGGVGNQAQPVGRIQRPGLSGDVAGRVPQPQEGLQILAPVLGDHLAVPVSVEAIHHDPVKAGELPDIAGEHRGELFERAGVGQPLQHRRQAPVPCRAHHLELRKRLPLSQQQPVGTVDDHVDLSKAHPYPQRVDFGKVTDQPGSQPCQVSRREQLFERAPEDVTTEHLCRVLRRHHHRQAWLLHRQQDSVRLDRARHADRFIRARLQSLVSHARAAGKRLRLSRRRDARR